MVTNSRNSFGNPVNCTQTLGIAYLTLSPPTLSSNLNVVPGNLVCKTPHSTMRCIFALDGNTVLKVFAPVSSTNQRHPPGNNLSISEVTLAAVREPPLTLKSGFLSKSHPDDHYLSRGTQHIDSTVVCIRKTDSRLICAPLAYFSSSSKPSYKNENKNSQ